MWKSKSWLGKARRGDAGRGRVGLGDARRGFNSVGCEMLAAGDQVRCLYESDSDKTLQVGVLYTIEVGQSEDGAMVSIVGIEGAFLASRFELAGKDAALSDSLASKREQLIKSCIDECLPRAAGAAMCAIKKLHLIVDGMKRFTSSQEIIERSDHMCERLAGVDLATDWTIQLIGVDAICERAATGSPFDLEQLTHDVKVKLRQVIRDV